MNLVKGLEFDCDFNCLQSDGPYNNVLKLKPPMVFDHDNADRFVDTLDEILDEMKAMDEL